MDLALAMELEKGLMGTDAVDDGADSDDNVVDEFMGVNISSINKPNYENQQVLSHKTAFEEWLFKKFNGKTTSYVINLEDAELYRCVLKGTKKIECASKRFQFKKKRYSLNQHNELCRTTQRKDSDGKLLGPEVTLPVVWLEIMFEKIYALHAGKRAHQGSLSYKK